MALINGRVDGGFLGILSTSFCLDLRGMLRLFCLYSERDMLLSSVSRTALIASKLTVMNCQRPGVNYWGL